jgi:hypothetical protein
LEVREKSWRSVILANQAIKAFCCFCLFFFCIQLESKSQQKELQLYYNTSQFYTQGAFSFSEAFGGRAQFIGLGLSSRVKPWFALKLNADAGSVLDYDLPAKELMSSDLFRLQLTGQFYLLSPFKRLKYINRFWQPYIALGYNYWNIPRMNKELNGPHFMSNSYRAGFQLEIHEHFRLNLQGGFDFSLSQNLLHSRSFSVGITYRWGKNEKERIIDNLCPFDSSYVENLQNGIQFRDDTIHSLNLSLEREIKLAADQKDSLQKVIIKLEKKITENQQTLQEERDKYESKIARLEASLKPYKNTTLRSKEFRISDWSTLVFYDSTGSLKRGPLFPETPYIVVLDTYDAFPVGEEIEAGKDLEWTALYLVLKGTKYMYLATFPETLKKDDLLRLVRKSYPNAYFF